MQRRAVGPDGQQVPQPFLGERHVIADARAVLLGQERIDTRGGGFLGADVARLEPGLGQPGNLSADLHSVLGDLEPAPGEEHVGIRLAHVADQVEGRLSQPLTDAARLARRRLDSDRPQPQGLQGEIEDVLENLVRRRPEVADVGVRQQPRLNQVATGDAKVGKQLLECGIVPESDEDRLFLGQAVLKARSVGQDDRTGARELCSLRTGRAGCTGRPEGEPRPFRDPGREAGTVAHVRQGMAAREQAKHAGPDEPPSARARGRRGA